MNYFTVNEYLINYLITHKPTWIRILGDSIIVFQTSTNHVFLLTNITTNSEGSQCRLPPQVHYNKRASKMYLFYGTHRINKPKDTTFLWDTLYKSRLFHVHESMGVSKHLNMYAFTTCHDDTRCKKYVVGSKSQK